VEKQFEDWITHVTNDFDTATDLFAFAVGVIGAIADAVLLILSEGILTTIEAGILAAIGAAVAGTYAAGKSIFSGYWTDAVKEQLLCITYAHIGDDGSFSDSQFSDLWNDFNLSLPGALAKTLFIGFLSSVGRQGLNNMAASGKSTGSDCSICSGFCDLTSWGILSDAGVIDTGTRTENFVQIAATLLGDGKYYVVFTSPSADVCCDLDVNADNSAKIYLVSGSASASWYNPCGIDPSDILVHGTTLSFGGFNMNGIKYQSSFPFTIAIDTTRV
jgi:hypothetical protein